MPYAIVVEVPEARDDCFVVMPFSEEFSPLYDHITSAAADLRLRRVRIRSGEMQQGPDFVADIASTTRSARLVVAVCSPEPATGRSNPNVMYELGYAVALGKPTLILTSDTDRLPSNLGSAHALQYDTTEFGTHGLTLKIRVGMSEVLDSMENGNPLTDPGYHHIRVADERHMMFHNPAFWNHFRRILSFAKLIHDEHQQIDTAVIDTLNAEVMKMYKNPALGSRLVAVLRAWNQYQQYYQGRTEPNVYTHLRDELAEVDAAFEFMQRTAAGSLRSIVEDCRSFYATLRDRLREYPNEFRSFAATVENDRFPRVPDNELIARLVTQAGMISRNTKTIVMNSDRLIVNLIEMIRRPGE